MKFQIRFLIPVITLVTGIFTFSIIALETNSFWFKSGCDVSILKSPSIYLGDSIFVPLFNYFLFVLYENTKSKISYMKYRSSFWNYLIIAFLVSLCINYVQHIAWTKDQINGFIDLEYSKLSLGGWYHFVFASIEMTVMLLFLWVFMIIILEKNKEGFKFTKKLIWTFFFYSFCAVLDLYVKILYVVHEPNLFKGLIEYLSDLKVFFSGIMIVIGYYFLKFISFNKWDVSD